MKRSPRVRLSAAVKRLSLRLSILSLTLLLLGSPALATTPIAVDMYQDMESGNAGNVLTPTIMNASSHGTQSWIAPSGTMWVSTQYHHDLPGPVLCGGVTYNGTGGSRSWVFNNNLQAQWVECNAGQHPELTTAMYYTTLTTLTHQVGYDIIDLCGFSSFACFQTLVNSNGSSGLVFHLHSADPNTGIDTADDPLAISITAGKTYWMCMKYCASGGKCFLAAYDPDNSYAQVGTTLVCACPMTEQWVGYESRYGRVDAHGNQTNDLTQAYIDHILLDYTNAAFPLLPSGCNDTTAPSAPPVVRDGTGDDQSIALSTTQLSANWDPAVDNESGIKGYQYAIGTTQGGTNIVNWTQVINVLGVTKTGLSLTTGQTYYFSVKAMNGVGLWGSATNSNGQTVGTDTTPPGAPPAVRDGGMVNYGPDIDETTSTNSLYANFDFATDPESGISCYQYGIGTTPGATNVVNWTNSPANAMNIWQYSLSLTQGQRYYFTVRAINNAGLTGPATNSDGAIVVNSSDTTPPSAPPAVRDGTGTDISTTSSTTQLSANWDNSTDNESGISGYQYAIGTTAGGTQTVNWTSLGYVTTVTQTGLSLTINQTYYFSVKALNGRSIAGSATNSNGQTVVSAGNQPPSAPANVRDGVGADITYTTSATQLSANWDASTDPDGSVTAYQYAIGTSTGGTQTVNWTTLGNVTTVTKTGLGLTSGQTYYFSVKAVDNQGLAGNATNSNGQTVDTTAPSAPANVRDGTGTDIVYTSSTTQLSANWDAAADAESGISGYQYAIGTTAGGTQTVNWTSLGNVTTVTKTGLTLTNGQTYFFSVQAVNGAGLTGSATNSNGQKVDTTAPSAPPTVRDGTGTDISTTSSNTQLSANWDASTDNESGISGYQYAIGTSAGGTQTVNWTLLGNVTTVTKTGLSLTNGQTYYFSVEAVNGAGLTGGATNSNGQTVQTTDVTPPSAPPAVRDGTGADISTTNSTTQLSANWDASTDNESGISGYQYAIGTTAGGTQTVNWTSLGNVTTVTKTGLTLTVGQTYFFSVQAVNGAGLTGSATNSNGQTVVSGSTVIYFQDNFESWTVHGGAWSSVSGELSTQTLNTSTDYAKAGAKSLKLTDTDTTSVYGAYLVKNFSPTISGNIYVRFFVYLPTGYTSANTGCASRRLLRVCCQSNRGQMSLTLGATPLMEEVGAWGGSEASSALSENTWHCIEMYMASPSASTPMQYWIDGTSAGTLNGSFSGSSSYDHIDLGDVCLGGGANGNGTFYVDELVVSNSYIGTGITSPVTYFSDNFENWTVHGGAWSTVNGESSTHTLNTSTDQARSGTKSLKLTDTDTTATTGASLTKNFSPTISGDIYVRFYVFFPTGFESTNSGCRRRVLRVNCGGNRGQMSFQDGAPIMEEIGAWGAVTGSAVSENAWHCIEIHITTPTATTVLEFWVDGVLDSSALMANFSTSSTWDHIDLGDVVLGGGTNGTGTFYMDEAVISNSYNGPLP